MNVKFCEGSFIALVCILLESVGHAAARLPALPGHAAVALDDDCEHLLLPRHNVHDLDLAVLNSAVKRSIGSKTKLS